MCEERGSRELEDWDSHPGHFGGSPKPFERSPILCFVGAFLLRIHLFPLHQRLDRPRRPTQVCRISLKRAFTRLGHIQISPSHFFQDTLLQRERCMIFWCSPYLSSMPMKCSNEVKGLGFDHSAIDLSINHGRLSIISTLDTFACPLFDRKSCRW